MVLLGVLGDLRKRLGLEFSAERSGLSPKMHVAF
jgi:hypothetical protein